MKRKIAVGWLVVAIGMARAAFGVELVTKDNFDLTMYGRLQMLGFAELVQDDVRGHFRVYPYVKQARMGFRGGYEKYKYDLQAAFASEEGVTSNVALTLLDYSVDIPVPGGLWVKVGQFKIPYSRERLQDAGFLAFVDRSIQNQAFTVGRDVGVALHGRKGIGMGALGIFTGGGRDIPIRYLPEDLGFPMTVLRLGIDTGLDQDIWNERQTEYEPQTTKGTGLFVNGMYTKDSSIGHSTALQLKQTEKSLLLDPAWNPYIGKTPFNRGDYWQVGGDLANRHPLGSYLLESELEANYGVYQNDYGNIRLSGGRAQVGVYKNPFDVALRGSVVFPDDDMGYFDSTTKKTFKITSDAPYYEVVPAVTYYLKGKWAKLVLDVPVLIGVPVSQEQRIGAYVLTEQQSQTSVVATAGNRIERQTVVQGRLMLQVSFD